MKHLKSVTLLTFFAALLISCEKDYLKESDVYSSEGFITVNITGQSIDGYVLDDSFTASQFSSTDLSRGAIYYIMNDSYFFDISRSANYLDNSDLIRLHFELTDNSIRDVYLDLYYEKLVSNNQVLYITMYDNITSGEITEWEFNEATGLIKGHYSVTSQHSNRLLRVTGDFEVTVRERVQK